MDMSHTSATYDDPKAGSANVYRDHKPRRGLFALLEKALGLECYFEDGFPVKNLARIVFLLVLGILYISNAHYAEDTTRKITRLQDEVEDLRTDYITLKADLMFATKQSEVAKRVKSIGLKESLTPPDNIQMPDEKY